MNQFPPEFRDQLNDLMRWRRDVRHFHDDKPVPDELLGQVLDAIRLAPSVGLSEPWRIVTVKSDAARAKALANFEAANAEALNGYSGDRAKKYAGLKLSGMRDAPVHLAVFCDDGTDKGAGLGAGTMPEARRYSVVSAIMNFWLAARAHGLGVGWVSIIDPLQLATDLDVPEGWALVAYLCVGWPIEASLTPELEKVEWEKRDALLARVLER
ncbi:5,6-dimethylbenzimidazole synthase [Rhodobacterales bacterium 52_120_T64]|nr:5,6-dimethylbenzimidazole synthase [Rhodobacterales bacterium 52_120_T64]